MKSATTPRIVDTLSVLIEAYEEEHHYIPDASGVELLTGHETPFVWPQGSRRPTRRRAREYRNPELLGYRETTQHRFEEAMVGSAA